MQCFTLWLPLPLLLLLLLLLRDSLLGYVATVSVGISSTSRAVETTTRQRPGPLEIISFV